MSITPLFQTETLIATKLYEEDVETLLSFYSDSEAMKFRASPVMKTLEDGSRMIENHLKRTKDISEVRASCIKENHATIRIFENAGYTEILQSKYPGSILFVKGNIKKTVANY